MVARWSGHQSSAASSLLADHSGRRTTLLVNWWRERPQPPNVVDFDTSEWRELGLLLSDEKRRELMDESAAAAEARRPTSDGRWAPMPLVPGETARMSYEIAPTDMYFYEMAAPSVAGNWHVHWPEGFAVGPIARLDLTHHSCVKALFSEKRPKAILVLSDGGRKHWQGRMPKWLPELMQQHAGQLKFVLADPVKTPDFMRAFGLAISDTPTVVIHETHTEPEGKHMLPPEQRGVAGFRKKVVVKFISDFLEGRLAHAKQHDEL
ncbi:hypothetical protein AB1Y20_016132 [Prymnesium parvum]|uniref:Thioredoxin-like fold domain-containing protein n=1 Tax=Prymnesium parvum TaxID=97485 RepID=A0AB34K273_PRYPA